MAKKISDLTAEAQFSNNDYFVFTDESAGADKRITGENLRKSVLGGANEGFSQAAVAEPSNPPVGESVQWLSNGTGAGDAGDVMVKINVGGTVKTVTLIDYSGA